MPNRATTIAEIAARHLGVHNLTERKCDSLDFHDCAVWNIKAALESAYDAGEKSLANDQSTL
jgi:hypothetical protein